DGLCSGRARRGADRTARNGDEIGESGGAARFTRAQRFLGQRSPTALPNRGAYGHHRNLVSQPAHIEAILEAGGKVYDVGGAVRDRMLGRAAKDADLLVTGVPMDKLRALLARFGAVHAVGESFGVLKFQPRGQE